MQETGEAGGDQCRERREKQQQQQQQERVLETGAGAERGESSWRLDRDCYRLVETQRRESRDKKMLLRLMESRNSWRLKRLVKTRLGDGPAQKPKLTGQPVQRGGREYKQEDTVRV
jgi:hypothetical protein